MENLSEKYLLMIEPDEQGRPTKEPLNDDFTEKVRFIFGKAKPALHTKGFHRTRCGKVSDNIIWRLPDGVEMNSLCVYYAQFYRGFIPISEARKVIEIYDKLTK